MSEFTRKRLAELLSVEAWPCVTLYVPTSPGADSQQGRIRLKKLLGRVEDRLVASGIRPVEARQLLEPAFGLLDDSGFWNGQRHGLLVVVTSQGMQTWRFAETVPELATVSRRVCVRPLATLCSDDVNFHVLAVSQKGVRLLAGDRSRLAAVHLPSLPRGLIETLNMQPPQVLMQILGAPAGGRGDQGTMYHGQGGEVDRHKDELLSWFRTIDRPLHDYLGDDPSPLVFAGVEYLFPIYKRANTCPQLCEQAAPGNPDHSDLATLHRRAAELLAPRWQAPQVDDRRKIERHFHEGGASYELQEALVAATEGRVEALFVDCGEPLWGRFDHSDGTVKLLNEDSPGSEDLLDVLAANVWRQGGRVHAVNAPQVPGGKRVAVLYRYPAPAGNWARSRM